MNVWERSSFIAVSLFSINIIDIIVILVVTVIKIVKFVQSILHFLNKSVVLYQTKKEIKFQHKGK